MRFTQNDHTYWLSDFFNSAPLGVVAIVAVRNDWVSDWSAYIGVAPADASGHEATLYVAEHGVKIYSSEVQRLLHPRVIADFGLDNYRR